MSGLHKLSSCDLMPTTHASMNKEQMAQGRAVLSEPGHGQFEEACALCCKPGNMLLNKEAFSSL
jgi:hypothetical protein